MPKSKTKATSVKKAVKSNKKKKFSLKNLDFKKNWKKLSYLGLAGFLAFSSIGYGVWKNYVQDEASAYYWGLISSTSYFVVYGCAIPLGGSVYRVAGYYRSPNSMPLTSVIYSSSGQVIGGISFPTTPKNTNSVIKYTTVYQKPYVGSKTYPNCNTNGSLY